MATAKAQARTVTKTVTVVEDVITLELSPDEAQNLRSFLGAMTVEKFPELDAICHSLQGYTKFNADLINKYFDFFRSYEKS